MGNINSAIEQSSLPDPNATFDTGLPIVNESNEDAKKVRYNSNDAKANALGNHYSNVFTKSDDLLHSNFVLDMNSELHSLSKVQ